MAHQGAVCGLIDDNSPRLERVPDTGKACLELEQRVLPAAQTPTEVEDSVSAIFRPVAHEIEQGLQGVALEKFALRPLEMVLDDAAGLGEEARARYSAFDLDDAQMEAPS